jgi:CID domain
VYVCDPQNGKTWLLAHSHAIANILEVLAQSCAIAMVERKLFIVYLINDVLYHSFKTHPNQAVLDAMRFGLVPVLAAALSNQATESKDRINKVIRLWGTRNIFDAETVTHLESASNSAAEATQASAGGTPQPAFPSPYTNAASKRARDADDAHAAFETRPRHQ